MITKSIEIENIGPVEHLTIPVPEDGGLVVLKSKNGGGKSNTLAAVESLATGKGKVSVRDGALRGQVSGLGVTITASRSTRRIGELEVESLEGKLSISELVDPGLKDPGAADAKRIKALVSLTGSDATASEFHKLLGSKERFEEIVSPSSIDGTDWVQMADKIKRDIEKEARKEEDRAEYAEGKARGLAELGEVVDGDIESPEALQSDLIEAAQALSVLQERKRSEQQERERASKARARIERLSDGLAERIDMLTANETATAERYDSLVHQEEVMQHQIDELQSRLRLVQEEKSTAWDRLTDTRERLSEAKESEQEILELQGSLEVAMAPVDDSEIEFAERNVAGIKERIERAAVAKEKADKIHEANAIRKQAAEHRRKAIELRNAAKSTDAILSELVAKYCDVLRVEHGRLVLNTTRGTTYFAELSHGERVKLAIDIAIRKLGTAAIVVLEQEFYEGLDAFARRDVHEHAKLRKVLVLTAESSTDSEINAHEFEPESVEA